MGLMDKLGGVVIDTAFKVRPDWASRLAIGIYCRAAPARPRRWAARRDYTDWPALKDMTIAGRHLPPCRDPSDCPAEPDEADLVDLFRRKGDMIPGRSSLLFMSVAQWFTDSFLRSDSSQTPEHPLWGWTDSNHEVDLCALYGLTEEKTRMLRRIENGALTHELDYEIHPETKEILPPRLFDVDEAGNWTFRDRYREGGDDGLGGTNLHDLHDQAKMEIILARIGGDRAARLKDYRAVGLEHGNVTIGYMAVNTLFLRAHNHVANVLRDRYCPAGGTAKPGWNLERVFQTARLVMIVILLKVVIEDYIAHIAAQPFKMPIGMADDARWGKPNRIAIEFNLLYRWHPMVPDAIELEGRTLGPGEFMHNAGLLAATGLGKVVAALSRQPAGRMGLGNHPQFMSMPAPNGDPSALQRSIRMARGHRLQSYNAYRRHFGLSPVRSFEELVGDGPEAGALVSELKRLYKDVDKLEWFTGIFAEGYSEPLIMGELMQRMVANDAFTQALNNPLLSKAIYEVSGDRGRPDFGEDVFTPEGRAIIDRVSTVADLLKEIGGDKEVACTMSVS